MKHIVLDTSAVIHINRENLICDKMLNWINNLNEQVILIVSIVTIAELLSFIESSNWGIKSLTILNNYLEKILIIDINKEDTELLNNYKFIDLYLKNKTKDYHGNLKGWSHIKMSKNDIWIAATTLTLNATLLTSDNDFDHLNKILNCQIFNH